MTRSIRLLLPLILLAVLLTARGLRAEPDAPLFAPTPLLTLFETGADWGEHEYTTDVALGDADGDGRAETLIARRAEAGARVLLIDDAAADFALLRTIGDGWGVGAYATAVAFGNVDDDPALEMAVARASSVNERVQVFDDAAAGYVSLGKFGLEWPQVIHAIDVAFGDVDGDGRDELGIASNADSGARFHVYDDAAAGFAPLGSGGETWGATAVATSIAFGDVDGDGDDEMALGRNHNINARFIVYDAPPDFVPLLQGGETWGAGSYATAVAFGNVDGDAAAELGVARRASLNERAYVFDDAATGYATLQLFGQTWAGNAYATSIAFGDVDGDGRDEVGLARHATVNERFAIYDDARPGGRPPFAPLWAGGATWPGEEYARVIAFGNVDDTPQAEPAVGRFAAAGPRAYIFRPLWVTLLPLVSAEVGG